MSRKGYNWGVEWKTHEDARTGVSVTQLTCYKGNAHHQYFTNPGWYGGGSKLVTGGDRENRTNLFSVDLRSGEITQLTDLAPVEGETEFMHGSLNAVTNEAVFWYDKKLWAISLDTLEERLLWVLPEKQNMGMVNCTSDGKYAIFCMSEDLSDKLNLDLLHGYVGFKETFEYRPLCKIMRIPMDGSRKADVLHAGNVWMGHLNTSLTQPTHLTFCHEGPWELVDNRMWAMDTSTGKVWPLRERRGPGEAIGHEYWFMDGLRVGYHGTYQGKSFLGSCKFDGSDIVEGEFPQHTWHVHSNDRELAVGDGKQFGDILLWLWNGTGYDEPRVLCRHRCSMNIQANHVHPRISPDGDYILYTSDTTGYGAPYIARLPGDLKALPFAEAK